MTLPAGWLSASAAAKLVTALSGRNLDVTRLRKYAQAGTLRGVKHGTIWLFRERDVERFARIPRRPGRPPVKPRKRTTKQEEVHVA